MGDSIAAGVEVTAVWYRLSVTEVAQKTGV